MRAAEKDLRARLRARPGLDIDLALAALGEADITWALAFRVWNAKEVDLDQEAERWVEVAGAHLGIGDAKRETAHQMVGAYEEAFRRAAAAGPAGGGFQEAQAERRHQEAVRLHEDTHARQDAGLKELLGETEAVKSALAQLAAAQAPESRYAERAASLRGQVGDAVDHMNALRLQTALSTLDRVVGDLDALRTADPKSEGAFVGLRQVALAVKGQVLALMGDRPTRDAVAGALRGGGPIVPDALRVVALFAADIGDGDWLRELVPSLPTDDPEWPLLTLAAKGLQGGRIDPEIVLAETTSGEDRPNLMTLRINALANAVTPDRAVEAATLINRLDALDGDDVLLPRKRLLTGQMTFELLRRVLEERLDTPGLDREALVDQTRSRLREAVERLGQFGEEHQGGHLEALVETVNFLEYVEEHDAAARVHQRVRDLQPGDGPIGAIERRDVTTPEQVEQLEAQGVLDPARRALMLAHQELAEGRTGPAFRKFGAALEQAESVGVREMALGDSVIKLVAAGRVDDARHLVDEEGERGGADLRVRDEWLAAMVVRVVEAEQGAVAALNESASRIIAVPRSLVLHRQRRDLLVQALLVEKDRLRSGGAAAKPSLTALAEQIGDVSQVLYGLLPVPRFLVDEGRSWAERGQWERAWALLARAVDRGIEDEAVRAEVERYRQATLPATP